MTTSPFHDGEKRLQALTGEAAYAEHSGRCVGTTLTTVGERMLSTAATLNIALSDADGRLWSFVAIGRPGLVRRVDKQTAFVDHDGLAAPDSLGPLLATGAPIGLVAMDLASARRFRINGTVGELRDDGFTVAVTQTCPNCPKYIQQRQPAPTHAYAAIESGSGTVLDAAARALITSADTFFVASRNAAGEHDASHRGGQPGFVSVRGNTLVVPDYIGNSMFMTLGNFTQDPAAGLTFVDFDAGAQLNLTGTVALSFDDLSAHDGMQGRYWTFEVAAWQRTAFRPEPAWALRGYSRFNPKVGRR